MADFKEADRLLTIQTPLGPDKLLLESFQGREEISRLFSYELSLLSEDHGIDPRAIVGKNVTVVVGVPGGGSRPINGHVRRWVAGPVEHGRLRRYTAEIVPWLWFLTRTSDCRIFPENETAPSIIEKVLKEHGLGELKMGAKPGDYPKLEYCVQYRESDFDFISRLMEEAGIFYFFLHEEGKHTLVIDDKKAAFKDFPEPNIEFSQAERRKGQIYRWDHEYSFRSGKVAQTDYNFKTPSTSLLTTESTVIKVPTVDKYELFDYPGEYIDKGTGQPITRVRMEAEEGGYDTVGGAGSHPLLAVGHRFKLKSPIAAEDGKSFVVSSITHGLTAGSFHSGQGGESEYENTFTCFPDGVPFRPERTTPRPIVRGPQTAVVVGPPGETIYPDEFGRVKVQFHWDRYGKKDEKSSCWIRVSQNWAGQSWGGMFIPHVGHEVVVSFLEGDPDRPLITGRVYNAEQTVPLGLPANKTKSIIRDHGGNEIIMEGEKGKEQIRLFSPKHQTHLHLGNSFNLFTLSDYIKENQGNTTIKTLGTWFQNVIGDVKLHFGANVTDLFIGWNHKTTIGWVSSLVGGFKIESINGFEKKTIRGLKSETILGHSYKKHVGTLLDESKTAKVDKNPSLKELYKDVMTIRSVLKERNKASKTIETAGKMREKATEMLLENELTKWVSNDYKVIAKAEAKITAANKALIQANVSQFVADSTLKVTAAEVKVSGGTIKLN